MEIEISRMANNGRGIGTAPDGKTVFVPGTVPGDSILAAVTADKGRFYEAEAREILTPSPDRIDTDCSHYELCGGCCFRQMAYEAELTAKAGFVRDAFRRIGGFEGLELEAILPSPLTEAYRNKAEFAVGTDADGRLFAGFYSEKTHRVIPVPNCRIVPAEFLKISDYFVNVINLNNNKIKSAVEDKGRDPANFDCLMSGNDTDASGRRYKLKENKKKELKNGKRIIRHLVLRRSGLTGEIMLIIVSGSDGFTGDKEAAERVREKFPVVTSVILNINPDAKGPVMGLRNRVLSGAGFLKDQICGVPVEIGPLSFFQVNTPAAEKLYRTAAEFAEVRSEDVVLDLYCGMGTIGLSMAAGCRQLIGGEIVPEAVESARRNAAAMGLTNTRFLCGDAAKIAGTLIRESIRPTLIILDPPRKGCSPETLQAVLTLNPDRIVMVSCDPATAARDCRTLCGAGYHLTRLRPADLFPRTRHVETCVLLTHPFMSKS